MSGPIDPTLLQILIGLVTGGVYYLAQQHRDYLSEKKRTAQDLSEAQIRNSMEKGLQAVFPKILKEFPELGLPDNDQIALLKELINRSQSDLEDNLRQAIVQNLYQLSLARFAGEEAVDMFSAQGLGDTLLELRKRYGLSDLKPDTVSFAVPRILSRLLQEIGTHPSLKGAVTLIRDCQEANFRKSVIEQLSAITEYNKLDDPAIFRAVNAARQNLNSQATRRYSMKLAGREPDLSDRFDYMAPEMQRVEKRERRVPKDFENHTAPIDNKEFHQLLLERKKIFIVAGAGVGKTTFLCRLQLDLLKNRLWEAPLPVFENVGKFISDSGTLFDRVTGLLQHTRATDFSRDKAERIVGILNHHGRLCFLLDSLDQCSDETSCKNHFQLDAQGIFEQNRVVVACRAEHVKTNPELYRDIFAAYEWILLDGFDKDQLEQYLGPAISTWLNYKELPENFQDLIAIPFYANITRRIGLRPDAERIRPENRGQLLSEFEKQLFQEAKSGRSVQIHPLDEPQIKNLLYQLSLETLQKNHVQTFPISILNKYYKSQPEACKCIFDAHWVFFNRTLFEGKDESQCTFYHQLLQEYFAARRLHRLFEEDRDKFDAAIAELPYRPAVLEFLDDLLPHESVFGHCMDRFEAALELADQRRKGIEGSGHKFTWLLALRDLKGKKTNLEKRLQEIFDAEKKESQKAALIDGKFVKIPAGAFLMGGYHYEDEQPVRIVYLPEYWIAIYAETFHEYEQYCRQQGLKTPNDEGWDKGDRPVINVSWDDAKAYVECKGKAYGLPSEAQWEKAARGRMGRKYPWGNGDPDPRLCNFGLNIRKTVEVMEYDPQMYGIHQMAGNVWEWVEDYWHTNYEGAPDDGKAWVDSSKGASRVYRGGSWDYGALSCRSASRFLDRPGYRYFYLGFRLSRSVTLGA